jgi:hypothetical protein
MPPKPPTAKLIAPPVVGLGQTFTVDASGSVDGTGGGGITKYHYNFGDGTTETSPNATATHAYIDLEGQPFACRVTVTNKKGRSDISVPVTVEVVAEQPPLPVDCVLGPEVITAETPLEDCQPNGFQAVEVAWTKDIVTPPAHGGAACGPTSGTRIEPRACAYVPPVEPPPGEHPDFEARSARPDCVLSASLRTDEDILKYRKNNNASLAEYDAEADACRFSLAPNYNIGRQFWFRFTPEKAIRTVIGEFKFSTNWTAANGLNRHKFLMVRKVDEDIWYEPQCSSEYEAHGAGFAPPKLVRLSRIRPYAAVGLPHAKANFDHVDQFGSVHYDSDSVGPTEANYFAPLDVWVRFEIHLDELTEPGYCRTTYALTDETQDPVVVSRDVRLALDPANLLDFFAIHLSASQPRVGPEVWMWFRNITIHHGVTDPWSLLVRP